MDAENRLTSPKQRCSRRATISEVITSSPALDTAALRVTIQALWRKERRLGVYSPLDELCMDLDTLDMEELYALRTRIFRRVREYVAVRLESEHTRETRHLAVA